MSGLPSTQSRPEAIGRGSTRGRWRGLSALALAAIITGLDITVVVTALPTLSAMNGRGDARVLGGMIAGVVLLTIFVARQLRAGARLVDLELLRKPRFAVGGVPFMLTPFVQIVAAAGLVALFLPARAAAADR